MYIKNTNNMNPNNGIINNTNIIRNIIEKTQDIL